MALLLIIGVPLVVLLATGMVAAWAVMLRHAPNALSKEWGMRYIEAATIQRTCLQGIMILYGCAAILCLILIKSLPAERQVYGLYGGLNLLSSLVFYTLWRWTNWLICLAMIRIQMNNTHHFWQ